MTNVARGPSKLSFQLKRVSVVNNSLNVRAPILTSMAKFPCLIDTVCYCYFWSLFPICTLSIIRCYDRQV